MQFALTTPFDEVFLERVGIGQSELDVRELVDTVVLLVPPDAGDSIQAMKAAILEIADIYVVTKAENPAARLITTEIESVVRRPTRHIGEWDPTVIMTKADGTGIDTLNTAIDQHQTELQVHASVGEIRARRRRFHLRSLMLRASDQLLQAHPSFPEGDLIDAFGRLAEQLSPISS